MVTRQYYHRDVEAVRTPLDPVFTVDVQTSIDVRTTVTGQLRSDAWMRLWDINDALLNGIRRELRGERR